MEEEDLHTEDEETLHIMDEGPPSSIDLEPPYKPIPGERFILREWFDEQKNEVFSRVETADVTAGPEHCIIGQAAAQDPTRAPSPKGTPIIEDTAGELHRSKVLTSSQGGSPILLPAKASKDNQSSIEDKYPGKENEDGNKENDDGFISSSKFDGKFMGTITQTSDPDILPSPVDRPCDNEHAVLSDVDETLPRRNSLRLSASAGDPSSSSSPIFQTATGTPDHDNQPQDAMQDPTRQRGGIFAMPGATSSQFFEAIGRDKPLPPSPPSSECRPTRYVRSVRFEEGLEQNIPPGEYRALDLEPPGDTGFIGYETSSLEQTISLGDDQERERELAMDIEEIGQYWAAADQEQLDSRKRARVEKYLRAHGDRNTVNGTRVIFAEHRVGGDWEKPPEVRDFYDDPTPPSSEDAESGMQPGRMLMRGLRACLDFCTGKSVLRYGKRLVKRHHLRKMRAKAAK